MASSGSTWTVANFLAEIGVDKSDIDSAAAKLLHSGYKTEKYLLSAKSEHLERIGIPFPVVGVILAHQEFVARSNLAPECQQNETEATQDETVRVTAALDQLTVSPPSPDKRKFTVNGSIDKSGRSKYFFINTSEQNQDLYTRIHRGEYVMLHGPRAVGKSTRMLQACDDLASNFHCINVSLLDLDRGNASQFWKSISLSLIKKYKSLGFCHEVDSGHTFNNLWYNATNPHLPTNKKFILFIDEFDALGDGVDDETRNPILGTFRGLKESAAYHQLQCVVAIGVFSMVRLNTSHTSPFNVGEAVAAPLMTYEQVRAMFAEYMECKGFKIDEKVIEDVHERTGGHAGLVNLCGKAIDEEIRPQISASSTAVLTLPVWLDRLRCNLAEWLTNFPTMTRVVRDLSGDGVLETSCRNVLLKRFLCRDAPVPVSAVDEATRDKLESVGMVRKVGGQLVVSNSIVRMLAIWKILPQDRRDLALDAVPMAEEGNVDMLQLLLKSVSYFPVKDLYSATTWSFKKAGRGPDQKVPHEYYYQSQLASIIRASLPETWQFFPEVKKDGSRKRIDFVLETVDACPESRFVLELEATSSNAELEEHYARSKEYGKMISARHVWVVHFSAVKLQSEDLPRPPRGVHVLHLIHETRANNTTWSALYHGGGNKKSYTRPPIPPKKKNK